jgi:hypothetical protein
LKTPENIRLAHSTPIYLSGKWDAREDAAYFVAWIDALSRQTETDAARFTDPAQRDAALAAYREARDIYAGRAR